jgi:DNA-binding transcriptional ArsR family regulator
MVAAANMVEIAALVGDTARATMLAALMGGQALTSSELAGLARVSRATASEHLSKLRQARLLTVTQKRRNRYYRIASPLVAKSALAHFSASLKPCGACMSDIII